MGNMWSDKNYINNIITTLIFLVAINFMHLGQLFLPIICLILFIDNRFRFKVNNWSIFVVLCLFAATFCVFSYQLGFYCLIGFCLPMAYYIGSNLNVAEDNLIKLIYVIAFGMAGHLVMNFILELFLYNFNLSLIFNKMSHYDIWLSINSIIKGIELYINGRINTVGISLNYFFILSFAYYLFIFEKNKKLKIKSITLFFLSSIYCFALGRRTTLFLFVLVLVFSNVYGVLFIKKKDVKESFKILLILFLIVISLCILIYFNLFNVKNFLSNFTLFEKIFRQGFNSGRLTILFDSLKYYSQYIWGGQKISSTIGFQIHNLWGDIYDYAGIIPFTLMAIYSIFYFAIAVKVIKSNRVSTTLKLIIINIFICSLIIMLLEPLMTGSSIFLIAVILFASAVERCLLS